MSSVHNIPLPVLPPWVSELPLSVRIAGLAIGLPAIIIALNVLYQLYWPKDKSTPPVVFHYIPWFGSAAYYGQDPYKFLFECREVYGDLFTFILMGRRMTVALGPKGNNLSLGGKVSQVSAEDAYTHLTTPVFGKGVVYDCPNEMLMQQKKMIKHGLSTEALQSYASLMWNETDQFFKHELHFEEKPEPKSFEVLKIMAELIILTAGRSLQGREVRESMTSHFARLMEDLDAGFTPLNFMFPNLPLPSYRRRDVAQKAMSDFYLDIMRKRKDGESDNTDMDMIAALQGQQYKDGTPLTERDIAHMMIAILMAGQHTSSATSSWAMLHLAERPDIVETLYQEQKEKFGNPDGTFRPITYEDTKAMPVMDSIIRETLRLHAPIHSIMRKVLAPITVPPSLSSPSESNGYVIPPGHFIVAAPGVSAMDPKIWPEAPVWNPLRWSDEKGVAQTALSQYQGSTSEQVDYGFGQISKGTESPYMPFGAGRHRCVGESFAYLQLSIIISYIVRNYTWKLDSKTFPAPNYQTMIVLPLKGFATFTPRKSTA